MNKAGKNNYTLRKRYILTQWRDYVKREVAFITCIQTVIQKSLWSKGFSEIRHFSRQVREDRTKSDVLNKFRLKFWKRTCGNAVSVWRSGAFAMVSQVTEEVESETAKIVEEHQDRKTVFKEVNEARSERHIGRQGLRNLFQSWMNVASFMKKMRSKDEEFRLQQEIMNKRMAVWKWQSRKNAT